MSKHTPGIWMHGHSTEFGTFNAGIVYAPNGDGVAQIYGLPTNGELEALSHVKYGEYVSNARLIAAAPELLEALIECIECEFAVTDRAAITKARAAIAKATGEKQP